MALLHQYETFRPPAIGRAMIRWLRKAHPIVLGRLRIHAQRS
jgi:hypothetical protein